MNRWWRRFFYPSPRENPEFAFAPDDGTEVVALDTETTSLDPRQAEPVAIAAVKIEGNRILVSSGLNLLVKPTAPMPPGGIPTHQLLTRDLTHAMEPEAALRQLLHFIGSRPVVGYYLEFDMAILNRLARHHFGISLKNRQIEVSRIYFDKKIGHFPQKPIDLRFDTILEDLELPKLGRHDAWNDAIMTAMIYQKLQAVRRIDG